MMKNKKTLLKICGILFIVLLIANIVSFSLNIKALSIQYKYYIATLISSFISIIGCGLIAYSCFKSNIKFVCLSYFGIYSIVPSVVYFIEGLVSSIANYFDDYINFGGLLATIGDTILSYLPRILALVLLGLCFLKCLEESSAPSFAEANLTPTIVSTDVNEKIEQIEKLQKLFDIGAISKDEFEAKKNQILGN